jgi:hypothetical protein
MTLSIRGLDVTFSINATQHKRHFRYVVMLSLVMLSVAVYSNLS